MQKKRERIEQYFEELEKPIITQVLQECHTEYGNCSATITHVETNHRNADGSITKNNMARCNVLCGGKTVELQLRLGSFTNNKAIIMSIEESIPIEKAVEILKRDTLGTALARIGNTTLGLSLA